MPMLNDLGGTLIASQRALIRDLALQQILLEELQQSYMQSGDLDYSQYAKVSNAMRRCMSALGLSRREPKGDDEDETMTPLDYISRKPQRVRMTRTKPMDANAKGAVIVVKITLKPGTVKIK